MHLVKSEALWFVQRNPHIMPRVGVSLVVAWDVDGTLVQRTSLDRSNVHERAVHAVGLQTQAPQGHSEGMTDRQIIEALVPQGIRGRQELVERAVELIDAFTEASLADCPVVATPGVEHVLHCLQGADAQSVLVTGNTLNRARAKLASAGLVLNFDWERSAFGSKSNDRFDLAASWRNSHGLVPGSRLVIVGDTPLDIAAARSVDVEVVAVATGMYTARALRACSPDYLIEDWTAERDQFLAWILNY